MGSFKTVKRETTVADAVASGYAGLASLHDEMQDWVDNMQGTLSPHTNRYQTAEDAANVLAVAENEPEIPPQLADLKVIFTEMFPTRKGRSPSRAVRCSNACAALSAATDKMRAFLENMRDEDKRQEIDESCIGEIEWAVSEVESVEFPGMYD